MEMAIHRPVFRRFILDSRPQATINALAPARQPPLPPNRQRYRDPMHHRESRLPYSAPVSVIIHDFHVIGDVQTERIIPARYRYTVNRPASLPFITGPFQSVVHRVSSYVQPTLDSVRKHTEDRSGVKGRSRGSRVSAVLTRTSVSGTIRMMTRAQP